MAGCWIEHWCSPVSCSGEHLTAGSGDWQKKASAIVGAVQDLQPLYTVRSLADNTTLALRQYVLAAQSTILTRSARVCCKVHYHEMCCSVHCSHLPWDGMG